MTIVLLSCDSCSSINVSSVSLVCLGDNETINIVLPVVNSKLSRVILGVVIRSRRICQEDSLRCSVR